MDSTQDDNFDAETKMLAKIKYDIISILIPRVKKKYIMSFIQTYSLESGCSRTSLWSVINESYAIGVAKPTSYNINTYDIAKVKLPDVQIVKKVQ